MVKQLGSLPTNYLSVFDHFMGLLLKGLTQNWKLNIVMNKIVKYICQKYQKNMKLSLGMTIIMILILMQILQKPALLIN